MSKGSISISAKLGADSASDRSGTAPRLLPSAVKPLRKVPKSASPNPVRIPVWAIVTISDRSEMMATRLPARSMASVTVMSATRTTQPKATIPRPMLVNRSYRMSGEPPITRWANVSFPRAC